MLKRYQILAQWMEGNRVHYIIAIVAMALANLTAFLVPLIGKFTIDAALSEEIVESSSWTQSILEFLGGESWVAQHLWIAGSTMVGISLLSSIFVYLKGRWSAYACEAIAKNLRDRLYRHLQHLKSSHYSKSDTGDLIQRCTSDVETLREFLATQVLDIAKAISMFLLVIPLMLMIDVKMSLIALTLMPVIFIFSYTFFSRVKTKFQTVDESEGKLTTVIQENLTGIRVVRAFARQDYESEKFKKYNSQYRDLDYDLVKLYAHYFFFADFMSISQMGLVLFGGAWMVNQGMISIGTLFTFLTYVGMLMWPLRELGKILSEAGKAIVALDRINEILEAPVEEEDQEKVFQYPPQIEGGIVFDQVSFTYEEGEQVLDNLSFSVKPGETVAIIGPTGAGKSTVIQLLLRLYEYTEGNIRIDGLELKQLDRKYLRTQIGAALQEPFLYTKSLRENIKLSRKNTDDRAMISASKDACIHDSIQKFKDGYDTVIGERGVTLSGGQLQRVALSRTFLKEPPILILDDSLSAVDTHTEGMILEALAQRHGRSTSLIITHRISCCVQADRILVLDQGKLVQEGDHKSLLQKEGFYQDLWKIQTSLQDELSQDQDAFSQTRAKSA